jgi:hypothetical protein
MCPIYFSAWVRVQSQRYDRFVEKQDIPTVVFESMCEIPHVWAHFSQTLTQQQYVINECLE